MDKQELVRIMTGLFEGNHGAAQNYAENNQPLNREETVKQNKVIYAKALAKSGHISYFD